MFTFQMEITIGKRSIHYMKMANFQVQNGQHSKGRLINGSSQTIINKNYEFLSVILIFIILNIAVYILPDKSNINMIFENTPNLKLITSYLIIKLKS